MEQISIGDKVFFEHPFINNYNRFWTVLSMDGHVLSLMIDEGETKDRCFMDLEYIKQVEKQTA